MDLTSQYSQKDIWITGLSRAQEEACCAVLNAFLIRHGLTSWGLNINLSASARTLDISVVASAEFDFQIRSHHFPVDRTLDLEWLIDQCLETHFNGCMHGEALAHDSQRSNRKPPRQQNILNSRAAQA
jgi:hypothetical protein